VTVALEHFAHYNSIWEKDREADLEAFLKEDPKLTEFEAEVKRYEELEVEIMGLAEFYDVGPIALYTGQLFIFAFY
jgi:dynein heavy chain